MIVGTGIDLVEIDRVQKIIVKWGERFLNKVFTLDEIRYCYTKKENHFQSFAGIFAAKEAFAKALGTGMRKIIWQEIEIRSDNMGKPSLYLSGLAQSIIAEIGITNINVSISHSRKLAVAQVIMEK